MSRSDLLISASYVAFLALIAFSRASFAEPLESSTPKLLRVPDSSLQDHVDATMPSMEASDTHVSKAAEFDDLSPKMLRQLMRPSFDFAAEWQAETDRVGLTSYAAGIKIPTYPVFGPPPPLINAGFSFTDIDAPASFGLPTDVHETSLGVAWMRSINATWMTRLMIGTAFATDGNNVSSDAWRFRGGAFAIYRRSPEWTWTFGALALGRNDIPVVPAVGVIHQPNPGLRWELMLPKPRVAYLLADDGLRQQWGYVGAGLNGGTWGVERMDGVDDQLTYGDFRVMLGWESAPATEPGMVFTRGRKVGAELGYVFSRDFEFKNQETKIPLGDTVMLRLSISF